MRNIYEGKKIESLDCIRGIACLIVLAAHIVASSPYIGKYASGCGKIGVWCFMIMSGFLSIVRTLVAQKIAKSIISNLFCNII